MEGLVEHGYTGIDPRSKVWYLLDGIKTDKFDAVKTQIMSDERSQVDFDACVTLYKDYIRQMTKAKSNTTVNISELKTGGKRKAKAIEDRYYTKEELNKSYCAAAFRRDNTLSLLIVRPSTKVFVGHASVLIGYRCGSLRVRLLIIVLRHCSSDTVECSADKCWEAQS
jgi:hypothetical protein